MIKLAQGLILLICVILLGLAAVSYEESLSYPEWKSVKGTLEMISLQNASSPTSAGAPSIGSTFGWAIYQYRVNGKEYFGHRILPLQYVYLPRKKVTDTKLGKITIYYDPENPSKSYMYLIPPVTQILMLICGSILLAIISLYLPKIIRTLLIYAFESTY